MIVVEDEIGKIVNKTAERLGKSIYYTHDHLKEIANMLTQYDATGKYGDRKYPRIILLQDFAERRGVNVDIEVEATPQLLIVADSSPSYRGEARLEKVFKPILLPIYEEFILRLFKSRLFNFPNVSSVSHDMIKRLAMSDALNEEVKSQGGKNLFNDHLDGIEIRNLRLQFKKTC